MARSVVVVVVVVAGGVVVVVVVVVHLSPPSSPSRSPLKGGFDPAHVGGSSREPVLITFDLDARVHLSGTKGM